MIFLVTTFSTQFEENYVKVVLKNVKKSRGRKKERGRVIECPKATFCFDGVHDIS